MLEIVCGPWSLRSLMTVSLLLDCSSTATKQRNSVSKTGVVWLWLWYGHSFLDHRFFLDHDCSFEQLPSKRATKQSVTGP